MICAARGERLTAEVRQRDGTVPFRFLAVFVLCMLFQSETGLIVDLQSFTFARDTCSIAFVC